MHVVTTFEILIQFAFYQPISSCALVRLEYNYMSTHHVLLVVNSSSNIWTDCEIQIDTACPLCFSMYL